MSSVNIYIAGYDSVSMRYYSLNNYGYVIMRSSLFIHDYVIFLYMIM